jgi:RNA polymerase sigma-70 factor, ECF subfamily
VDADQRFAALYQGHYAAVLGYACRRTDPDSARDVTAETFLVVWRRLPDVPADPAQVRPWLYGVARRVLANADRSRRRSEHLAARLTHDGAPAATPDPAEGVTERVRLRQALRTLPERDQEVLRLIGWEELDLAGAAVAMGCSRAAMAVRLHRARRRMERALRTAEAGHAERSPGQITARQEMT